MKNGVVVILAWCMVFFCFRVSYADKIPKFGKVSKEELQMTSVPEAPDEDYVYLFDNAEMFIQKDFTLRIKRHVRIKILSEAGKDAASIKLPYWHKDRIHSIKAHSIQPNGKKVKMSKKNVFEEKVRNQKQKVFTIPGVEVGSVIEYKYEFESDYLHYLEPWYFQHEAYTLLSQISITIRPGFNYHVFYTNTPPLEPVIEDILIPGGELKRYTWRMTDLPPIREEPYMRTKEDYMAALHFQLVNYRDAWTFHQWIDSWPALVEKYREKVNPLLKPSKLIREVAQKAAPESLSTVQRIKNLYHYVRENIETTERGYLYPRVKPQKVFKENKGAGTEKNALLISMLRSVGISAYPLLISTRNNGEILLDQPRLTQFNYMIVVAMIGPRAFFLDTRARFCPFNLLPTSDLVSRGLLVDDDQGKFVNLPRPRATNMTHCITEAFLEDDGALVAESVIRFEGYKAYRNREKIREDGEEDFVNNLMKRAFGEVEIDSFEIFSAGEIETPLRVKVNYRLPAYAQDAGEMMYLKPAFFARISENPFKRPERYFPVEYLYSIASEDKFILTLPPNIQVLEKPANTLKKNPMLKIKYGALASVKENKLVLNRYYFRRKTTYPQGEYKSLRHFYDIIIAEDQNRIVLKRISLSETE